MTSEDKFFKTVAAKTLPEHFVTSSHPWAEVHHIMSRDVATVSADEDVASAARIMAARNISCIIVLENESVVGILTETDLVKRVVVHQRQRAELKVADVMSAPVESIASNISAFHASLTMQASGFKHLPVLDDGRLVGIVTQTDLTEALGSSHVDTTIAGIMSTDIATVECKATVAEVAERMSSRNISCVVVVEGPEIKGIITERDILKRVLAAQRNSEQTAVEQVMSCPVITTPAFSSVFSTSKIMERMHVRRLVVTDNDRLCGIVTQTDVFREIKEKCQRQEEQNLKLLEESEYGIYTTNLEGKTTYVNPAFMRLLGVNHAEELVEQPLLPERFWIDPQERVRFMCELKEAAFVEGKELALVNSQGQRVYVALMSTFTKSSTGRVNGSQGVLRDITERKLAAQELRKAHEILKEHDRLKTEFTSTISHELRTPLGILKNIISNATAGCFGILRPELGKNLQVVESHIDRLARLMTDFLDISRIEAGRMELNLLPVAMQSIISEVVGSFMAAAAAQNIELKSDMPDATLLVKADHQKIVQVLMNLVGNAIKFVPPNGRVVVSARESRGEVCVEVADDGPGIDKKDIDKIFDRFVQIEKIVGPGKHGTGMGLSIAKKLVELHGGHIRVESTPGAGTTFCFVLPRCPYESQYHDQSKAVAGQLFSLAGKQKNLE
ncbi:MAG TPA: CBS domain-containing protein [Sedimentisphaerales bacterium]|nr:CBS domain-containing protein [Sedimentisphaerales bacterium]